MNDPYRQPDGSLRDPEKVQEAAPAHPDEEFGAKELVATDEVKTEAAVDVEGAKAQGDLAEGPDQTVEAVGADDPDKNEAEKEAEKPLRRSPGRPRKDAAEK